MAKPNKSEMNKGGEKISFKKAAAAQKLYWDVLIGKKKIKPEQLPQSVSFNLHHLKSYLNEVEQEFNKLNVPYAERAVSIVPIAYEEKGNVTMAITPSVLKDEEQVVHQFNRSGETKKSKSLKAAAEYNLQLDALNAGKGWP